VFDPGESDATGTVFNLQRFSTHDGPGIRTTVFLKGCPLQCPWCHNPESLDLAPQVLLTVDRCLSCGACVEACPRPSGPLAAGRRLGEDGCDGCQECFDSCPTAAREVAGRRLTVSELLAEVERDRPFFDESGGGVTFSGGEPLQQSDFLVSALAACRAVGLRTAVDTAGCGPRHVVEEVAAATDLLLWDVKLSDSERHRELVGMALEPIMANLEAVAALGTPMWLRLPVVGGLTDDDDHVDAVAALAARLPCVERVSLLPYHPIGTGKVARLGGTNGGRFEGPTEATVSRLAQRVRRAGVQVSIGG